MRPPGALLTRVSRGPFGAWGSHEFPYALPMLREFESLDTDAPVTLFVGENGTGKSTLLEALAVAAEVRAFGSEHDMRYDPTLEPARALAAGLRLEWRVRQRHGFFLRAEDYFGWARAQARLDARLTREHDVLLDSGDDEAKRLDDAVIARNIARYDSRSHGETFLDAFTSRITAGRALYLLDEPEAALSPQRQLAFVGLVLKRVATGAQFVIASHAPIVLALALAVPGARLYSFDDGAPRAAVYEELSHVTLTREFLAGPERYLRLLGVD